MPNAQGICRASELERRRIRRYEAALARLKAKLSAETGSDQTLSAAQTATGPLNRNHETMPSQPAASPDAAPAYPAEGQTAASADILTAFERAIVLKRQWHGAGAKARLEQKYQQALEAGQIAQRELASHIERSLSGKRRANPSIPARLWFAAQRRAGDIALRQALRSARRLGLKRVLDTDLFFAEHCAWYVSFCALSSRLFGAADHV